MAYASSKNAQVFADQYDITSYLRSVEPEATLETLDSTVLGDAGRRVTPVFPGGGVSFEAFHDRTAGSAFNVIKSALQSTSSQVVTVFLEGATIGYPAQLVYANTTRFGMPVPLGQLVGTVGYFMPAAGGVDFGVSLHAKTAETANANSASVDNGAATSNGGVGHLHITATAGTISGGVLKIQHSADNSAWADLATFNDAADDGVGADRVEVAAGTTVNRYLRAVLASFSGSGGPSVTYVIAFARR